MLITMAKSKILDFKNLFAKNLGPILDNQLRKISSLINFSHDLTTEVKQNIENKWKNSVNHGTFDENSLENKFYVLSMFPYPSGNLHMGHVRVYTISDAISRFHRLKGRNVFQPIGFDAFGLPAENAARDRDILPEKWTENNISTMKEQFKQLGFSFDWKREIKTCSPDYYKFTQYLFLLLFKEGLVYRDEAIVNWDPVDETVLADEQVDSQGRSWRSGAVVEKKNLKQWFIRTTHFAQSLLSGLDDPKLKDWKDVIELQKHWLGECDGASFKFELLDIIGEPKGQLEIWIRYPEMIPHAAFVAVSSNSVLGRRLIKDNIKLTVKCPFSLQLLPIFVTDSLEYPEGCDSKLGIPCYSDEDANFAKKEGLNYNTTSHPQIDVNERYRLCNIAMEYKIGGKMKSSKLRDWLISRQRHWGTPIPIVHCHNCGPVPVPFKDLPVYLPPRGKQSTSVECPNCNQKAFRETDTMDTFVDSAWYFLRYADPLNEIEPFSKQIVNSLLPVDVYVGGKEHAVLHLYYARFMCHFLHSIGLLNEPEPFLRLLVQGMVTGKTYFIKDTGKYIRKEDVIEKDDGSLIEAKSGNEVAFKWEKMSKSRFNGVEPDDVLQMYGIDTTRLLILADVAPTSQRRWSSETFAGVLNWQKRIWSLMDMFLESRKKPTKNVINIKEDERLFDARNFYIKGTTFNYAFSHQLSVAISKMQGLTNSLKKSNTNTMCNSLEFERSLAALIIMLFPMAPHFCLELWSGFISAPGRLDHEEKFIKWNHSLMMQSWPELDSNYILQLICKVNNSVKATVKISFEELNKLDRNSAMKLALEQEKVSCYINGCDILKFDYEIIDSFEANINIFINHLQRRKILQQQ